MKQFASEAEQMFSRIPSSRERANGYSFGSTFSVILFIVVLSLCITGCASENKLSFNPQPGENVDSSAGHEWNLERQGIRFRVVSTNRGSINTLTIYPAGLEVVNTPIVREIDGSISGVETADLNEDGSPEIYLYITSAGSGSYGSLVAYSANRKKSLSDIYLPPLKHNEKLSRGYMGHDSFAVVGHHLVRSFPVYLPGDINAAPRGGLRQIHYVLVPGEAGWRLEIDAVVEK